MGAPTAARARVEDERKMMTRHAVDLRELPYPLTSDPIGIAILPV